MPEAARDNVAHLVEGSLLRVGASLSLDQRVRQLPVLSVSIYHVVEAEGGTTGTPDRHHIGLTPLRRQQQK